MKSMIRRRSSLALIVWEEGHHPWLVEARKSSCCYGDAPPHAVPVEEQHKVKTPVLGGQVVRFLMPLN